MPEPHEHHTAEQTWAWASNALDETIENVRGQMDLVARVAESHDPSAMFDYIFSLLRIKNRTEIGSFQICELICAAALVKLIYIPKAEDPLEKLFNDD